MSDQRVALITGAAGGIGAATVSAFVDAGWQVVAVDRVAEAELPGGADYQRVDLKEPDAISGLFDWLQSRHSRLDALINNAAIQVDKSIAETSLDEWDQVLDTNLRSAFLMVKHGLELLSARSGAVVNVSSAHARATSANIAAYAASKGGLTALTRAMALEFGQHGVRVNAVLPGAVDTPMLRASPEPTEAPPDEAALRALAARTPLRRIGEPREIAEAILFLADGDRSSFITGEALVVDGGALARLSTE